MGAEDNNNARHDNRSPDRNNLNLKIVNQVIVHELKPFLNVAVDALEQYLKKAVYTRNEHILEIYTEEMIKVRKMVDEKIVKLNSGVDDNTNSLSFIKFLQATADQSSFFYLLYKEFHLKVLGNNKQGIEMQTKELIEVLTLLEKVLKVISQELGFIMAVSKSLNEIIDKDCEKIFKENPKILEESNLEGWVKDFILNLKLDNISPYQIDGYIMETQKYRTIKSVNFSSSAGFRNLKELLQEKAQRNINVAQMFLSINFLFDWHISFNIFVVFLWSYLYFDYEHFKMRPYIERVNFVKTMITLANIEVTTLDMGEAKMVKLKEKLKLTKLKKCIEELGTR